MQDDAELISEARRTKSGHPEKMWNVIGTQGNSLDHVGKTLGHAKYVYEKIRSTLHGKMPIKKTVER